jgi:hypothetical protein
MSPVDQTRFFEKGKSAGDCARAAVASIFGLPLEAVPDFPTHDASEHWGAIDEFLSDRGIDRLLMGGNYCPDVYYLASGPSARGCSHMVVMKSGELAHDPHPSRAGLLSVDHVNVLVPVSLSGWRPLPPPPSPLDSHQEQK